RTLSPPFTNIPLRPPIQTSDLQIVQLTHLLDNSFTLLLINSLILLLDLLLLLNLLIITSQYPQANLSLNNTPSSHYTPQYPPSPSQTSSLQNTKILEELEQFDQASPPYQATKNQDNNL